MELLETTNQPRNQEPSVCGEGNTPCIHQTLTRHILRKRDVGDGDSLGDIEMNEGTKKIIKRVKKNILIIIR